MRDKSWRWGYLVAGIALRVALLVFGAYQDAHSHVPYTDVDYSVFNDGAHAIVTGCPVSRTVGSELYVAESDLFNVPELADLNCARGIVPAVARFVLEYEPKKEDVKDSWVTSIVSLSYTITHPIFHLLAVIGDPYSRETYRYTPLLALLLTPGHLVSNVWVYAGKLLFAAADIGCALLMWRILDIRAMRYANIYPAFAHAAVTHLPGILWLVNPFPAQISTRGSSDSLVGLLILAFLSLLLRATPETALVDDRDFRKQADVDEAYKSDNKETPSQPAPKYKPSDISVVSEPAFHAAAALLALAVHVKLFPVIYGVAIMAHLANYRRHALAVMCGISKPKHYDVHELGIQFACRAAVYYILLNFATWCIWGQPFLDNALFYHFSRRDHRHNFSIYFLPTYLGLDGSGGDYAQISFQLLNSPYISFIPQFVTVAAVGLLLGGSDLIMSCFVQTVVFVAWNKVYTSQYFLWYLWFVPIVGVTLRFRGRWHVALLLAVWVGTQAMWLYQAYRLEFEGQDSFVALWFSSLALLAGQAWAAGTLVKAWARWRVEQRAARVKATKSK
ncbi:GPI mannosyltransferase 1 [Malassezia cuniculi]|uniref:GPI mannosyltransferase 1 n=1 Tax=Malassezia cuniculi TaxID=948313 RepID=A0AAF0ETR9_9BASI|nr:GPI mannosyltransferase 1 [Malassezia cuniculi]